MSPLVVLEKLDALAIVTMSNGKVNAMNLEFCRELAQLFQVLDADPSIRAVVIQGNSKVFSAGVDLKRLVVEPLEYIDAFLPALQKMFEQIFRFTKPLVSAISGHALAGGCVVASAGDYRVLARDAKIGMPELRVGLALPPEGIEIFRFAVAQQFFQRVVTSGASFENESALSAGLADELIDHNQLLKRCIQIAIEYQQIPADVFRLTKEQIRLPVLEKIEENKKQFGNRIRILWRDPQVRHSVAEYVRSRL